MNKDQKEWREFIRSLSLLSQLGVSMAACVLVGVFIGRFLDRLLGSSPWLLLIFSLLGAAASFKLMFDLTEKK